MPIQWVDFISGILLGLAIGIPLCGYIGHLRERYLKRKSPKEYRYSTPHVEDGIIVDRRQGERRSTDRRRK